MLCKIPEDYIEGQVKTRVNRKGNLRVTHLNNGNQRPHCKSAVVSMLQVIPVLDIFLSTQLGREGDCCYMLSKPKLAKSVASVLKHICLSDF